jgi:hypothetical protein
MRTRSAYPTFETSLQPDRICGLFRSVSIHPGRTAPARSSSAPTSMATVGGGGTRSACGIHRRAVGPGDAKQHACPRWDWACKHGRPTARAICTQPERAHLRAASEEVNLCRPLSISVVESLDSRLTEWRVPSDSATSWSSLNFEWSLVGRCRGHEGLFLVTASGLKGRLHVHEDHRSRRQGGQHHAMRCPGL